LAEKYSPGANLGIRTGMVEGALVALVVVDLDSADAIEWAKENLPTTPIRTVTGRGEHWFYRHPGSSPIRNGVKLRGQAIDVRGDGGMPIEPMFAATRHGSDRCRGQVFLGPLDCVGAIKIDDDERDQGTFDHSGADAKVRSGRVFFGQPIGGLVRRRLPTPFDGGLPGPVPFGLRGT
jgi:hypothetical protein